jgi:hypothetical protein
MCCKAYVEAQYANVACVPFHYYRLPASYRNKTVLMLTCQCGLADHLVDHGERRGPT